MSEKTVKMDRLRTNEGEFAKRSQTPISSSPLLSGSLNLNSPITIGSKYNNQLDSDIMKVSKMDKFYSEFYKSKGL